MATFLLRKKVVPGFVENTLRELPKEKNDVFLLFFSVALGVRKNFSCRVHVNLKFLASSLNGYAQCFIIIFFLYFFSVNVPLKGSFFKTRFH